MKTVKSMLTLVGLWVSGVANASAPVTGTIKELWVNGQYQSNIVFVQLSASYQSPACSPTLAPSSVVIKLQDPGMKEAYAMVMAAIMSGKEVTVAGDGTCTGTSENLRYIYVKN